MQFYRLRLLMIASCVSVLTLLGCSLSAGAASNNPGHLTIPTLCRSYQVVSTTSAQGAAVDEGGYDPRLHPTSTLPLAITVTYQQRVDRGIPNQFCNSVRAVTTVECHTSPGMDLCRNFTLSVRLWRLSGVVPTSVATTASTTPYPTNFAGPITPTPTTDPALQPTATPVATLTPGPVAQAEANVTTLADGKSISVATGWTQVADPCDLLAQATATDYNADQSVAQCDGTLVTQ